MSAAPESPVQAGVRPPAQRVILAPDKFKGSLTAREVADHLATGLEKSAPGVTVVRAPIADGGDGTLDALLPHGFTQRSALVTGSLGAHRSAHYGIRDTDAIVELAEADGLRHLAGAERRPLVATSRGVGELILAALDDGCRRIVLGLGGSANTDGGAGLLQALGARLLDADGNDLPAGGAALSRLAAIDLTGIDRRLPATTFVIASDVDNPLLGPNGAAAVYSPQKGADDAEVALLEAGLQRWAQIAAATTGLDRSTEPGAGAAGGVGFGALTFLNATLRPGIEFILELVHFDELLADAALVITGEGSLDEQTLSGKAPAGVAAAAARRGTPTIVVAGRSLLSRAQLLDAGFAEVYTLLEREPDVDVCMSDAGRLLEGLGPDLAATLARHTP